MDDKARRQRERELWLILIGALATGNKPIRADVLAELDVSDANSEDIAGLLSGIVTENKPVAQNWAKQLGADTNAGELTVLKAVIARLKSMVAHRTCVSAAKILQCSGTIETPEQFKELLETQLKRVQSKLK